jgi:uncharacterized protein YbjQ (UPF0145 family)
MEESGVSIIRQIVFATLIALTLVASADARNDTYFLSDAEVLNYPAYNNVEFHFANQTAPKIAQNLGDFVSNKIANTHGESDEQLCKEAALGALSELHDEAIRRGGSAVVNIESFWKGSELPDKTKYECHAGGTGGHVSLKGTIVKVAQ